MVIITQQRRKPELSPGMGKQPPGVSQGAALSQQEAKLPKTTSPLQNITNIKIIKEKLKSFRAGKKIKSNTYICFS